MKRLLGLSPVSADAYAMSGWLCIRKGDVDRAVAAYENALKVAPPDWKGRQQAEQWLKDVRDKRNR